MNRFPLKKLTLALATAGALLLTAPVLASSNDGPAQRLAEKLELTSEQQVEINALFQAHREQMRTEGSRESRDRRGDWREGRMALNAEIRELLSPEQVEQFDAMGKRQHRGHKGRGHGGHRGQGAMFQSLDLTDEQRGEMRELMREHRSQENADRSELRQQMREILTEEQLTQLDAARAERGQQRDGQRRGRGQRNG